MNKKQVVDNRAKVTNLIYDRKGDIKPYLINVVQILVTDEQLTNKFEYHKEERKVYSHWADDRGSIWEEMMPFHVKMHIEVCYDFSPSMDLVTQALEIVARDYTNRKDEASIMDEHLEEEK